MRILIIEDSPKMGLSLQKGLKEYGFVADLATCGEQGEELAATETYDVIVLDVLLPDRDGLNVCRNLRRREMVAPILMLTALSDTPDKVAGLDAGADDYLTKPFDFEELIARVRALMRRGRPGERTQLRYGDVEMDLAKRRVTRAGRAIQLTQKEFALLEYFMREAGSVLTRTAISQHVWDMNFNSFSNVIDVYVSALRKKLDKPFDTPLIQTVVGVGYRFGSDDQGA